MPAVIQCRDLRKTYEGKVQAVRGLRLEIGNSGDGAAVDRWRALPSVESVRHDDGLVCLTVREPHLTIPALLEEVEKRGVQLLHLSTRQASLEDVFVRLTGRHLRED